jgi:hypothetical protein
VDWFVDGLYRLREVRVLACGFGSSIDFAAADLCHLGHQFVVEIG